MCLEHEGSMLLYCEAVDFGTLDKMPPLTLKVGTSSYSIRIIHILNQCVYTYNNQGVPIFACSFELTHADDLGILGIPFFNSHYLLFYRDAKMIGKPSSPGIYPKHDNDSNFEVSMMKAVSLSLLSPFPWYERQDKFGFFDYSKLLGELGVTFVAIAYLYTGKK